MKTLISRLSRKTNKIKKLRFKWQFQFASFSQNPLILRSFLFILSIAILSAMAFVYKKYKEQRIINTYAKFLQEINEKTFSNN